MSPLYADREAVARGRRRFGRLLLLPLLFALLAAHAGPAPARAQGPLPGSFAAAPCPFGAVAGLSIDCGYLTVAESRRNFSGRTIQLAVATLRSPNPARAADPAVFLSGGPGQPALPLIPLVAVAYAPVLAQRDIIFIDQRGTGYSRPALNCPFGGEISSGRMGGQLPLGAQPGERPAILQAQLAALLECGRQFQAAGVDLSAYNSVENAADLEDLRRALGHGPWNLIGGSYGTRLALTAMQYRPETIRSAVLDSVYPLEANFHTGGFASYSQALDRLFAACRADQACNTAYPNLPQAFDELVPRLNANAIAVPLVDLATGELIDYIPLTGVDVSSIVFQLLYGTPAIPLLPRLISEVSRGETALLSLLLSALVFQEFASDLPPVSLGMQVAVQCNEDVTFATAREFVAARDQSRRASALAFSIVFNEAILEVCAAWGLGQRPVGADNQAVRSAVPALIIGGELDPITPSQNAAAADYNLSNAFVIIYPRGGHTPSFSSPCLAGAVASFLANPGQRPDTACLAGEAPLPFVGPP